MTCILITKTRIYTDTLHFNEANEEFHSLTKVKPLRDVIRVKWTALDTEPVTDDFNCESFVDCIHGYSCSGNNVIADRLADSLMKAAIATLSKTDPHAKIGTMRKGMDDYDLSVSLNETLEVYKLIVASGFVNATTHCNVILIGEKACYAFEIGSRVAFIGKITRSNPTCYGTGAAYASKVHYTTGDPVLALYTAMWYDNDQTGGMIDIWDLPTVEMPVLRRVGICNRRSLAQLKDILAVPPKPGDEPLPPDLISQELFSEKMEGIASVSEQVGFERGAGFLSDPKKRSKKKVTNTLKRLVKKPLKAKPPLTAKPRKPK